MRKQIILMVAFIFIYTAVQAQTIKRIDRQVKPVSFDLHGTAYIGFVDLSNEAFAPALAAAATDGFLPVYFIWGQNGDVLYGVLVIPSEKKSVYPPDIVLTQYSVYNGNITGNTIKFRLEGEEDLDIEGPISGDILESGNKISLYMQIPILGRFDIGDIYRCNQTNKFSGQYLGSGHLLGGSAAATNNVMVGILIQGYQMNFTAYMYDPDYPDEPYTFTGTASFNPVNGAFQFSGNPAFEEPDISGTIANGVMNMSISLVDGSSATATAYFFGQEVPKKAKLKKPKPASIEAGKQTKIRIKHRYGMIGSLISVANANGGAPSTDGIVIRKYSMGSKLFEIWLDVPKNTNGSFSVIMDSPNGKTAKSKRTFEIN